MPMRSDGKRRRLMRSYAMRCHMMRCDATSRRDAMQCKYNAMQRNAMQRNSRRNAIQRNVHTTRYNTIRCDSTQYDAIQYSTMRCDTMRSSKMRCHTMRRARSKPGRTLLYRNVCTTVSTRLGRRQQSQGISRVMTRPACRITRCSKPRGSSRVGPGRFGNLTGRVGTGHGVFKSQGSGRVTLTNEKPCMAKSGP